MHAAVLFMCCVLLPFNVISVILSLFAMNNIKSTYTASVTSTLVSYTNYLESKLKGSDQILTDYYTNDDFIYDFLESTDWHRTLYQYAITNEFSDSIQITNAPDTLFIYFPDSEELLLVDNFEIINGDMTKHITKKDLESVITTESIQNGRWHLITEYNTQYFIRTITTDDFVLGAYINCDAALYDLYQNEAVPFRDADIFLSEDSQEGTFPYVLCQSGIDKTSASLYYRTEIINIYGATAFIVVMIMILIVFSILMIPMLYSLFRKKINEPLVTIRNAFHELKSANEDYRISKHADTLEFEETFQSFNSMAGTIQKLKSEALKKEEDQHRLVVNNLNLRLENLQLQIRPHFLQNMMNLLFTLIQNHQNEEAQKLVLYLSKYFRYMFRYGHDLELFPKEIEMVKEYLQISALHYQNAFTVVYQIDPLLSFLRLPPLLLHNFVENIIQHALIPGKTIHIVIYGEYDEDQKLALLQVSDDGSGMSEEMARMINTGDFSSLPEGKHVGIRNSINRLNYFYNGKASVKVDTEEGVGTTFTITIPYDISDESDLEQEV